MNINLHNANHLSCKRRTSLLTFIASAATRALNPDKTCDVMSEINEQQLNMFPWWLRMEFYITECSDERV